MKTGGGHTNTFYKKLGGAPMVKIKDFTIGFKKLGGGHVSPQFLYNFRPWTVVLLAIHRICDMKTAKLFQFNDEIDDAVFDEDPF